MSKEPTRNMDGSLSKYPTVDLQPMLKVVIKNPGNNGGYLSSIIGLTRETTRLRLAKLTENNLIARLGNNKATVYYEMNYYLDRKEALDKKHAKGSPESRRRWSIKHRKIKDTECDGSFHMNLLDQIMLRQT